MIFKVGLTVFCNQWLQPDGSVAGLNVCCSLSAVVCQLESSGKWPDELSAIAHVKTAFYASLSEQLSSSCKILSSPTASYVDILKSGYVFRVRIVYERELALMREELKYMSADKGKKYKSHIHSVESALLRVPKLTSVLSG